MARDLRAPALSAAMTLYGMGQGWVLVTLLGTTGGVIASGLLGWLVGTIITRFVYRSP